MESHLDANQFADLRSDLNVDRLRSKTASLRAATLRLLDEVERSIADLGGQSEQFLRLRPETDRRQHTDAFIDAPKLGRSGVPEALNAIVDSASRLRQEVDRVRIGADRHGALLRGTDLGDDARAAGSLAGEFVRELCVAASDHDHLPAYDLSSLRELADGLRSAIAVLGSDFTADSTPLRRPTGVTH